MAGDVRAPSARLGARARVPGGAHAGAEAAAARAARGQLDLLEEDGRDVRRRRVPASARGEHCQRGPHADEQQAERARAGEPAAILYDQRGEWRRAAHAGGSAPSCAPPSPPPPPLQPACHDDLAAATRCASAAHIALPLPSPLPRLPSAPSPPLSALSLSLSLSVSRAHLPRASQPSSAQSTTHARGTTSPTSCAAAAGTMGSRSAIGSRASPT